MSVSYGSKQRRRRSLAATLKAEGPATLRMFAWYLAIVIAGAVAVYAAAGQLSNLPIVGLLTTSTPVTAALDWIGAAVSADPAAVTTAQKGANPSLARDVGLIGLAVLLAALMTLNTWCLRRILGGFAWRRPYSVG